MDSDYKDLLAAILARHAQHLAAGGPVHTSAPIAAPTQGQFGGGGFGGIMPPHPGQSAPMQAQPPAPAPTANNGIARSQTFGQPNQVDFQAQVPTSTMGFDQGLYTDSVGRGQNTVNALTSALQAQAAGQGPSLAQSQLQHATDANAGAAAGAIASQRGMNPALMARLIAQNQASTNQAAAGQSAELRAQEQQSAQQQLGQLGLGQFGTAGRLLTDNDKMSLEQNQGNQNAALHAQDTNANISLANQNTAQHNLDTEINAAGGAINGIGSVLATAGRNVAPTVTQPSSPGAQTVPPDEQPQPGSESPQPNSPVDNGGTYQWTPPTYARGGVVGALMARHYANGGPVPTYDYSGMSGVQDPRAANLLGGGVAVPSLAMGPGGAGAKPSVPMDSAHPDITGTNGGEKTWDTAAGAVPIFGAGLVAVKNAVEDARYKHEQSLTPEQRKQEQINNNGPIDLGIFGHPFHYGPNGEWIANANGGPIPGKAEVKGDSPKNDTVPAVLSPGEIVLPRSVTQSDDPGAKAQAFVEAIRRQHGGASEGEASPQSYGELLQHVRSIKMQLAALEQKAKGAP